MVRSGRHRLHGTRLSGRFLALGIALALLVASPQAASADPALSVAEAYELLGARRTPFAPPADELSPAEQGFLQSLFALTDEAVVLNAGVAQWFGSGGAEGLHFEDYRAGSDAVLERIERLEPSQEAKPVRELVSSALRLQRSFLSDWHTALTEGRPFESQLTSEYGFHDGLHRSKRKLLQAYSELHALFPDVSDETHRAFHDHLRALSMGR